MATTQRMVWARDLVTPPEAPYPPAPWRAHAQSWLGVFRSDRPATLPHGLRPLLGARTRVVALVRYLPGSTLVYDELIIATPALLGWRPGLAIEYIWVDSLASLWGGRRIWGLPKEPAEFAWEDSGVRVSDDAGPLMSLAVDRSPARGPAFPLATASVGRVADAWAYSVFPMWARLGRAGIRVRDLSPRFGFTLDERPLLAAATRDAHVTFSPARMLPIR
ncbi:MAG TPA: acetoacetate decarboxylase family protein [Ktedonobacterales bacterium]|nr:acetoacetate decarboxylase family protein [Ktedonobacterales bacterium]